MFNGNCGGRGDFCSLLGPVNMRIVNCTGFPRSVVFLLILVILFTAHL